MGSKGEMAEPWGSTGNLRGRWGDPLVLSCLECRRGSQETLEEVVLNKDLGDLKGHGPTPES